MKNMKWKHLMFCLLSVTALGLFSACQDKDSTDSADTSDTDRAAVRFSIEWEDEVSNAQTLAKTASASSVTLSDDCESRGVETVVVTVLNAGGETAASASFACSAHSGSLEGISPGSGYTISVSGQNADGGALYAGSSSGITLAAGENDAGTIQVERIGFEETASGMEFVWIPAGCFTMGSPDSEEGRDTDESPEHDVCVDGFYMSKYEVTQGQWIEIMGSLIYPEYYYGDDYPMEEVSWDDCQDFIDTLNTSAGTTSAYRLPTEAEWEYACRAGTETVRYWGDGSSEQCQYANGADQSFQEEYWDWEQEDSIDCDDGYPDTAPVGTYTANAWGLYDMIGNISEWCQDYYQSEFYSTSEATADNPVCTDNSSEDSTCDDPWCSGTTERRVLRGGDWSLGSEGLRSASRDRYSQSKRDYLNGFRIVFTGTP